MRAYFSRCWMAACLTAACWSAAAATPAARADVKPAPIFAKGMVLQRDKPVPVWGTAAPGEEVTVSLLAQKQTTKADKDGKWQVQLEPLAAGGPHELTIAGKNTIKLEDVLVGEVWLCSGQSNMAWRMAQVNAPDEIAQADLPQLRHNTGGAWTPCSPQTAANFSATAYYFGRDLHRHLKVPVGLINRSVGGTSARLWTSREAIEQSDELKPFLPGLLTAQPDKNGKAAPQIGVLYEQHIRPVVPFAIRGVIWYQGESDAGRPDEYRHLFATMIRSWRQAFGQKDLPFLFVQLAPIGGTAKSAAEGGWATIREAQAAALALPKTGMAVIIDSDVSLHPLQKHLPGGRLALAARQVAYGESVVASGPQFKSLKVEGDKAILTFDHVGSGLIAKGDKLTGFGIAGEDGKFVWADAKIDGNTVVVSSPEVSKPTAVRYGWASNPPCALFNQEGLPASPFRTDAPK